MELYISDRFRNRAIKFFSGYKVTSRFDSIASTFELEYLFDPFNFEHKEFSCVGHVHECTLKDEGELILTGYILSIAFVDASKSNMVKISGYSLTGVLEDCQVPPTLYPLQVNGLSLKEISDRLLQPFGLTSVIHSSVAALMNQKFEDTEPKENQTIKGFLTELAVQKNIVITHNEFGQLVYTKAQKTKPIFHFERTQATGKIPGVDFSLTFNGQQMHSDIWALAQADFDPEAQAAQSSAVKNPYIPIVFRPKVVKQTSGNSDNTDLVADNSVASELKGMPLVIKLDRWRIVDRIVRKGEIISVTNPYVYLYKKTDWMIESVEFTGTPESKTAVLRCVIPEVYTGQPIKYIFAGINMHA